MSDGGIQLTEKQIAGWILLYRAIWGKDVEIPEIWIPTFNMLKQGCSDLLGRSTLPNRLRYGLTEDAILNWIRLFREKEGKFPSSHDKTIWYKNVEGRWVQILGTWHNIDTALRQGNRGLPGGSSLSRLKYDHGLHDDLTEDVLLRWIKLFHEKEGNFPSKHDKIIWDRDTKGNWIQVLGNWHNIDMALRQGNRSLPGGSSLGQLKKQFGLVKDNKKPNPVRPAISRQSVYNAGSAAADDPK